MGVFLYATAYPALPEAQMEYTRINNQRRPSQYLVIDNPGGTSVVGNQAEAWTGLYEEIRGHRNRGFAKRRAAGEVIMSPVSLYRDQRTSADDYFFIGSYPVWGSRTITGKVASFQPPALVTPDYLDLDMARAKDVTLTKCYADVNSPNWQSTVFAQEIGQTLAMLRSPFKGVIKQIENYNRTMRSYKPKRSASKIEAQAGAFASAHLEFKYGWKNLVYDIRDAATAFGEAASASGTAGLRSRRIARDGWRGSARGHGVVPGSVSGVISSQVEYNHQYDVRVDSGVIVDVVEPSKNEAIRAAFGLRGRDIPAHIWEVVPWSFVADWFVNVGDWLQASALNPSAQYMGDWTTTQVKARSVNRLFNLFIEVNGVPGSPYVWRGDGGVATRNVHHTVRTVNRGVPPLPSVNPGSLSVNQQIDGWSLVIAKLVGLNPKR